MSNTRGTCVRARNRLHLGIPSTFRLLSSSKLVGHRNKSHFSAINRKHPTMRKLCSYALMLMLSFTFCACGADGEIDEALVRDFARQFQEEVLPTKEEFRKMAEAKIAEMPQEDRAQAYEDLEEALAKWPTDEKIDEMVDKAIADMPTRAEIDEALNQLGEDVPGGKTLKNIIENAMDEKLPEGEEVNKLIRESMGKLKEAIDSVKVEVEKN